MILDHHYPVDFLQGWKYIYIIKHVSNWPHVATEHLQYDQ